MKLRRTKDGANFIVPIFWATLYVPVMHTRFTKCCNIFNKKAVLSQGNCTMPQLLFLV